MGGTYQATFSNQVSRKMLAYIKQLFFALNACLAAKMLRSRQTHGKHNTNSKI
jgi:hypothetical protein